MIGSVQSLLSSQASSREAVVSWSSVRRQDVIDRRHLYSRRLGPPCFLVFTAVSPPAVNNNSVITIGFRRAIYMVFHKKQPLFFLS